MRRGPLRVATFRNVMTIALVGVGAMCVLAGVALVTGDDAYAWFGVGLGAAAGVAQFGVACRYVWMLKRGRAT